MKRSDFSIIVLILIVVVAIGAYQRLEQTGWRWNCLIEECEGVYRGQ